MGCRKPGSNISVHVDQVSAGLLLSREETLLAPGTIYGQIGRVRRLGSTRNMRQRLFCPDEYFGG